MKKNLNLAIVLAAAGLMTTISSCKKEGCTDPLAQNYSEEAKKDDGSCTYASEADANIVEVSQNITADETWESDKTYILTTRIAVESGATLTIQPGTIIKAEAGTGANASALVIARGAKLMAQGTPSQPIIFTSVADDITTGQVASPNLSPDLDGLWGGLIILGNAHISSASGTSAQIEGIPVSDANGLYGGTDDADNSGVIQYVSIRHGGANIGEGNEINGLTLGGVGSGTTIDHIEIIANQDDGIEWFGGTVNVSHALIWNNGDDALDADQGWNGTMDNFIIINPGDEAMELDGPEAAYSNGNFTIQNGSVLAGGASGLVDNDDNTNVDMNNVYFFDLTEGQDFDQAPLSTHTFSNFQATLPAGGTLSTYFVGGTDMYASEVVLGASTVGASKEEFSSWSWANLDGRLTDF